MASQAASSITNFLLTFEGLRRLELESYAVLAMMLLVAGATTGFVRYVIANPLLRRPSSESERIVVTLAAFSYFPAALLAMVAGVFSSETAPFLLLAVLVPTMGLHEGKRQAAIAGRREGEALLLDISWLSLLAAGLLLVRTSSPAGLALLWAGSAALSSVFVGSSPGRVSPHIVRLWYAETRSLAGEFAILRGSPLLAAALVAAVVEPVDFGAWSGTRSLLGPVTVLNVGMVGLGLTRLSALARSSRAQARRSGYMMSGALALVAVVAGCVAWLILTLDLMSFGGSSETMLEYVAPVSLFVLLAGLMQGLRVTFQALDGSNRSALVTQTKASGLVFAAMVGASPFGVPAVAWASAAAALISVLFWKATLGLVKD